MSYSGDPSSSGLDAVRFWAQDTGATGLLSDSEVEYLISFSGLEPTVAPIEIAALVADRIAAKFAGEVSISSDGVSYSGDQLYLKYAGLAKELRQSAHLLSGLGSGPLFTGSRVGRQFAIGMTDNFGGILQGLTPSQLSQDTDWDPDRNPGSDTTGIY